MVLLDDKGAPTHNVTGVVGIPRRPANDDERQVAAGVLMRQVPATPGSNYAMDSWDIVQGSYGVVVEQHEPISVLTDKEIIDLKVSTPAPPTSSLTEVPTAQHNQWEKEYLSNRYLRCEDRTELTRRLDDVVWNSLRLTKAGELDLSNDIVWHRLSMHIALEAHLRGYPLDNMANRPLDAGFKQRFSEGEVCRGAAEVLGEKRLPRGFVVKYGKREYMRELYEEGRLQVGSASYFDKIQHNEAIRDQERKFQFKGVYFDRDTGEMRSGAIEPSDERYKFATMYGVADALPAEQCGKLKRFRTLDIEFRRDFRLFCVSSVLLPELFSDFEADACVIFNWRMFVPRLVNAMRFHMPNAAFAEKRVLYQDPIGAYGTSVFDFSAQEAPIPIIKHFGYAYQRELRMTWIPTEQVAHLDPVIVTAGSLKGFGTLLEL